MSELPYMQLNTEHGVYRWQGGEYIGIGMADRGEGSEFQAFDVINVWDYAKDEPRIPRTLDAFRECIEDWEGERAEE